ncbi:hypothetical protein GIB67_036532 [Kingdonia uniflora]|uniref:HAT C-terminal dimerisation domain-containing protein n=1 Tax=Kingdonia uniflora TaxID=39325 RepID=A0A7J7P7L7_9MAGN|nr:hypothetical protein GIB67_036532 [Kingdonia uniflora]
MDSFVASINVDFCPKASTSNENKKALENIHGYIADFFYKNSISFNCVRSDSYSKMMQAIIQYNDPSMEWWINFGSEVSALQIFAKRVLGLTSAASPCKRIWSTLDNIQNKKRNCLEHDRMRDIAYIKNNKRLKKRYEERISGKDIDPIVLKSLDECKRRHCCNVRDFRVIFIIINWFCPLDSFYAVSVVRWLFGGGGGVVALETPRWVGGDVCLMCL